MEFLDRERSIIVNYDGNYYLWGQQMSQAEFEALLTRLRQELRLTEELAIRASALARQLNNRIPNSVFPQYFGYFQAVLFTIERFNRQVESLSNTQLSLALIQEEGQSLAEWLGTVIDARIRVESFLNEWESINEN